MVRSKVMHVFLKSCTPDSRDEAVEDMKECRSTHKYLGVKQHFCEKMSRVYFMTDLGLNVTTNYHNAHGQFDT